MTQRWLLPDGIEEVLPPEAMCLEKLRRQPGAPADLACDRILVNSSEGWEVEPAGDSSE